MTEFSNILKECRNKIGLTQYAIAKNMNIAKEILEWVLENEVEDD